MSISKWLFQMQSSNDSCRCEERLLNVLEQITTEKESGNGTVKKLSISIFEEQD